MMDATEMSDEQPVLYENLELWMTRLPAPLRSLPIIQLAIPGSHDSMTYTIQRHNDVSPDEGALIRFFGSCFGVVTKPVIYNWCVTQNDTVLQQLQGGVRYFDLRLAAKGDSSATYFVHGLFGAEITEELSEIDSWLSRHPDEIVVLDFQHFYAFNDGHHRSTVDRIKSTFRGKICPAYGRLENVSLQWMSAMRYQVVVVYRNVIARTESLVWPSGLWPTPWPDTVSTEQLLEFLNRSLEERPLTVGFVSQCLLTPDVPYVLRHPFSTLHSSLGTKCQGAVLEWVERNRPGAGGLNIIIADYVSNHDFAFTKTVIQRNAALLARGGYRSWGMKS